MNQRFSLPLILRLSSFHIGSAMVDILVASVWNQVMIADFRAPAWSVGLLLALRYFLSPLSIWAGFRSDSRPLWGLRRTPYIWLGRLMIVFALPLLGLSMSRFAAQPGDPLGWVLATLCFLIYGMGTLLSGSTYLALVRDTAPLEKQGLAISIVQTVLIVFFPISAIIYSRWMETFDLAVFEQMVLGTALIGAFFWFFAIVGVERRQSEPTTTPSAGHGNFTITFKKVWQDTRTRRFLIFFGLATLAAWTQDAILEAYGRDVFGLSVGRATDFNRVWLGMTVITLVGSAIIWRKRAPERQTNIALGGLVVMVIGMGLLAVAALTTQVHLVEVALALFGAGFGVYTFGGLNLMAVMTTTREAGAYLGMWTVVELLCKGSGTFLGGLLRDAFLAITGQPGFSYGLIFALETVGLMAAVVVLLRIDVIGWARETGRVGQRGLESLGGVD
ncbi:MAG: BCD family MFS transporter [Ardenticatenales bacterium]|nr:BCD family MFS transporter [Ardenticatenales bacterium]